MMKVTEDKIKEALLDACEFAFEKGHGVPARFNLKCNQPGCTDLHPTVFVVWHLEEAQAIESILGPATPVQHQGKGHEC